MKKVTKYGLKVKNSDKLLKIKVEKNNIYNHCGEDRYTLNEEHGEDFLLDDITEIFTICNGDGEAWYNSKYNNPTIDSRLIGDLEVVKVSFSFEVLKL
jgi:hypothetical protein